MFAAKAFAITSLVLVGVGALQVSTPDNVVQCGDVPITITGATGHYHLSIVPAVKSCESDALFESDALTGNSYTWKVKIPAGTQATIVVDDDAGNEAWSGAFTVTAGDGSCLNSSGSSSAPPASSSSGDAYAPATSSRTNIVVNNVSATPSSTRSSDSPFNVQQGNTPTGAAFSNAQASLFTILAAMGVAAMAL